MYTYTVQHSLKVARAHACEIVRRTQETEAYNAPVRTNSLLYNDQRKVQALLHLLF